jgi:catechol 1,2-dioxygenase
MIITDQASVTEAVIAEMQRTPDARSKQILESLVRHLHAFVRDVQLTEREFQEAIRQIARLGQLTTPSHNEVMLIAGALGVSNLICLINNGAHGTQPTQANNLGPFWREGAPEIENGGTLLQSPTPGDPLFFQGRVQDAQGKPVAGAKVDVWHSSPVGLYENQDTEQAEMNLRGIFTTDSEGRFAFRSIKPGAYPVPDTGPAGDLLRAQRRHNWRPAHLHFLIHKPGYKTIASQVYSNDDPYLETDSQFGVTAALIGHYVRHEGGTPPAADVKGAWYTLEHGFTVEPGEARYPKPPISGKAQKAQ